MWEKGRSSPGAVPVVADDGEPVALRRRRRRGRPVRSPASTGRPATRSTSSVDRASASARPASSRNASRERRQSPVTGVRAAVAGRGLGDLLEGADQRRTPCGSRSKVGLARLRTVRITRPCSSMTRTRTSAMRALGDGELDDAVDLVPVDGVEAGPGRGLREGGRLGGQAEQPGRLGVERDRCVARVPMPQAGREGGQDVPHGGQGLTSAHCPTLWRGDRSVATDGARCGGAPVERAVRACAREQLRGSGLGAAGTWAVFSRSRCFT